MEPINNVHMRDRLNSPLCTDDRYIQVGYNVEINIGTHKIAVIDKFD